MKKFLIATLMVSFLSLNAFAQVGDMFPELDGHTLTDKQLKFPVDTKGKVTLIGMAYSKKSDDLLKQWFQPVYTTFVEPPQVAFLPSEPFDVNIYFIGLLKGLAKAASGKIETSMNKNLDPKLHKYTVISQVKIKPYKEALRLGKKDLPYFFVLDEEGKIVYATRGAYTDQKLKEIQLKIEEVEQNAGN